MADGLTDSEKSSADFRARLGTRLVLWSTVGLVLLAIVVMGAAAWTGKPDTILNSAQLLLSSLLPLFATWVGTILAFYYTKENFQTATQGTLDIVNSVGQRLASTKITEAMMPRSAIVYISVPAEGLGTGNPPRK